MKIDYSEKEAICLNLSNHVDALNKVQQALLLLIKDESSYLDRPNYTEVCSRINNLLKTENSIVQKLTIASERLLNGESIVDESLLDTEYHMTETSNIISNLNESLNLLSIS